MPDKSTSVGRPTKASEAGESGEAREAREASEASGTPELTRARAGTELTTTTMP